ncbi:hypothetical protein DY000_02015208 [Brassica cretica]|uniref:Uncharacterized protein n=1 Tax=Brassica cretica TaxID=69181 RepID=A0ABQ7DC43_BRACR|nr:hypothetical protein DY000_02015208 [Brassica cretica]
MNEATFRAIPPEHGQVGIIIKVGSIVDADQKGFVGRHPPPAELRGVSQAPPSMPARSYFGEFSTELPMSILLLHRICFRYSKKSFELGHYIVVSLDLIAY